MKFAVPYFYKNGGDWMNDAAEIIIDLIDFESHTESALVDFIKEHPSQRIIILIKDVAKFWSNPDYPKIIKNLRDNTELKNWAVCFNETDVVEIYKIETLLRDNYFINENVATIDYFYKAAISNYEQLAWIIKMTKVSDIYITTPLAFSVQDLTKMLKKVFSRKPFIRVYPNICQAMMSIPSLNTFFIRPEDVHLYEPYVDVMEIYATELTHKKNADIYFDIYNKSKNWMGDLKEYLLDCKESINNLYIFKDFGEHRLNCGYKCVVGKCNMCKNQKEYIDLMEKTQDKIAKISDTIEREGLDTPNEDNVDEDIREYIGETDKEVEYYEECDRD